MSKTIFMNTPLNSKKGKTVSKKEIVSLNLQQKEQQRINEMTEKANMDIQYFADNTIYEGALPENFSELVTQAFSNYSDLSLKMPWETYKGIVEVEDGKYTYQQMNTLMQILGMSNMRQMDIDRMGEYVQYKDALQIIAGEFITSLEAHKERIKKETELNFTKTVGEA